ncbi:AraC family transcriptional regulator [Azomonas macrocytogenes]|uniref:AraC-like DNA-binding protein n=1 Tax=Azomonas macrocytogenes TaxID=69962 RepID=A0A839T5X9_AZOMA|nr:AraC family transcriptional regulator [Azomonas macrocytogenes]MBB3104911.1 AraC-like DNA-binding protein [Azomonas macrocytogenes]
MSIERYSISVHFAQVVIKAARKKGLDEENLLKEAGISRKLLDSSHLRITSDQFSRLMLAIWRMGDDEFMGLAPYRSRHGVFALMARQAVECRTLGSVYHHLSRFYNLVNDSLRLELRIEGGDALFSMTLADPGHDPDYLFREFFMLLWHRFPSWLIGHRIPLKYITFEYPEPKHLAEYRLMFPCPARFNENSNCFVFGIEALDAPVVQTPATLRTHLKRAPLDWFIRQAYNSAYTRSVLNYLEKATDLASTNIGEIANELHLTERTLRRKLSLEGTSFQIIKDGIRRDMAIHYLNQPSISIIQISRQLGFSEPSAFTRAFRQWTGESPKTYRDAAQNKK